MADKNIVIDPGGIEGIREGINLQVFPNEYKEGILDTSFSRTANAELIVGGLKERYELTFRALVEPSDFRKLRSLISYNIQARSESKTYEVVIYNFFEEFTETAAARTRFRVPGTTDIEAIGPDSIGLTQFSYWVAMQGYLEMSYERSGACQMVTFTFREGTFLTSGLE